MVKNIYFEDLVQHFSSLPGVGKKSAKIMANYIVNLDKDRAYQFSQSIMDAKEHLRFCDRCFNLTDSEMCNICSNKERDQSLLMVVETYKDIQFIESATFFDGVYHVLGGLLNPLEGVTISKLKIEQLLKRVSEEDIDEVIVALPSSLEGDSTALYLSESLKPYNIAVTKPVRGIPVGSDIEHTDEITLKEAFSKRDKFE